MLGLDVCERSKREGWYRRRGISRGGALGWKHVDAGEDTESNYIRAVLLCSICKA